MHTATNQNACNAPFTFVNLLIPLKKEKGDDVSDGGTIGQGDILTHGEWPDTCLQKRIICESDGFNA